MQPVSFGIRMPYQTKHQPQFGTQQPWGAQYVDYSCKTAHTPQTGKEGWITPERARQLAGDSDVISDDVKEMIQTLIDDEVMIAQFDLSGILATAGSQVIPRKAVYTSRDLLRTFTKENPYLNMDKVARSYGIQVDRRSPFSTENETQKRYHGSLAYKDRHAGKRFVDAINQLTKLKAIKPFASSSISVGYEITAKGLEALAYMPRN